MNFNPSVSIAGSSNDSKAATHILPPIIFYGASSHYLLMIKDWCEMGKRTHFHYMEA
jgi:hypothetical protein